MVIISANANANLKNAGLAIKFKLATGSESRNLRDLDSTASSGVVCEHLASTRILNADLPVRATSTAIFESNKSEEF